MFITGASHGPGHPSPSPSPSPCLCLNINLIFTTTFQIRDIAAPFTGGTLRPRGGMSLVPSCVSSKGWSWDPIRPWVPRPQAKLPKVPETKRAKRSPRAAARVSGRRSGLQTTRGPRLSTECHQPSVGNSPPQPRQRPPAPAQSRGWPEPSSGQRPQPSSLGQSRGSPACPQGSGQREPGPWLPPPLPGEAADHLCKWLSQVSQRPSIIQDPAAHRPPACRCPQDDVGTLPSSPGLSCQGPRLVSSLLPHSQSPPSPASPALDQLPLGDSPGSRGRASGLSKVQPGNPAEPPRPSARLGTCPRCFIKGSRTWGAVRRRSGGWPRMLSLSQVHGQRRWERGRVSETTSSWKN
ncbi:WAS/WASL-interacting protein family member 1-like [Marmota monax]|uniref:WAS/WASL-interacting protein family member 1-like n=1 Tax=Marmota monax TaxID=9995 RepID=UPI0026EA0AD0|nr:WAS/WASL-interacting protein family member 1-like [Marmota monax]